MSKAAVSVLNKLSSNSLQVIAKAERIDYDPENVSKKDIASKIAEEAKDAGIKMLIHELSKLDLQNAVAPLDDSGKINWNNVEAPNKAVISKRLFEQVSQMGLSKFLTNFASDETILRFAELVELELTKEEAKLGESKSQVIKQICEQVYFYGFQALLETFDVRFLQQIAREYGLKGTTATKSKLVVAIASQTNIRDLPSFNPAAIEAKERAMEEAVEASKMKKKPSIKKGITYQELFQQYFLDELVDYCRDNNLKVTGTKPQIIRRIIAFLDGDKENTVSTVNRVVKPKEEKEKKETKKESKKVTKKKETKEQSKEVEPESEREVEREETNEKETVPPKRVSKKQSTPEPEPKAEEEEEEVEEEEEEEDEDEDSASSLKGVVICITGNFDIKRDDLTKKLTKAGATVKTSVTKDTNLLLAADPDSGSEKIKEAEKKGVKVVGLDYVKKFI